MRPLLTCYSVAGAIMFMSMSDCVHWGGGRDTCVPDASGGDIVASRCVSAAYLDNEAGCTVREVVCTPTDGSPPDIFQACLY